MTDILFMILGFVTLFMSGRFLVIGGVEIAKFFKVPTLVIGLTIVSFGTSAPELLVSLKAAFTGHPDIAIGNVVGSNISNIALVLGITALIFPIPVVTKLIRFDWPIMMAVSIFLFLLSISGELVWWNGVILFALLIFYNVHSVVKGRKEHQESEPIKIAWYLSLLIIAASSVGLVYGANWLVKGASGIARTLNVSERIISVSIIAFGTSVPELATSVVAALRRETDISIGNIIGSNIFNISGILGVTSMARRVPISHELVWKDMIWMLGISLFLFLLMVVKNQRVSRLDGILLIGSYGVYLYFLLTF